MSRSNKYLHVHSHIYFLSGRDPVVPRQLLSKSPVVWDYLASGGDARLSQVRVRAISTDKRKLIYTWYFIKNRRLNVNNVRNAGHEDNINRVIIGMWMIIVFDFSKRYISYVLPQTFACQALRGIMSRGWGLEWTPVYRGFLVTLAWITALLAVSTIVLKIRR